MLKINPNFSVSFASKDRFVNKWIVFNYSNVPEQQDTFEKSKSKSKQPQNKSQNEDNWRKRAAAAGLFPEDYDKEQVIWYERALKAGQDPRYVSEKDIQKAENSRELRKTATSLRIIASDEAIVPPDEFLRQEIAFAKEEIFQKALSIFEKHFTESNSDTKTKSRIFVNAVLDGKLPIENFKKIILDLGDMDTRDLKRFYECMPVKKTISE